MKREDEKKLKEHIEVKARQEMRICYGKRFYLIGIPSSLSNGIGDGIELAINEPSGTAHFTLDEDKNFELTCRFSPDYPEMEEIFQREGYCYNRNKETHRKKYHKISQENIGIRIYRVLR